MINSLSKNLKKYIREVRVEEILAYKIVETEDDVRLKTLFHGVGGTRIIAPETWIEANEKMVRDGTSKTWYLSGWHVLLEESHAYEYLKSFKNRLEKLRVVPVMVKELRPKEHSRQPVFLAKHLKLIA